MKKFDVVGLGELLIDFTQNGLSEQGNGIFEANPGGAVCNVLSMLSKLGKKTAFISRVGDDAFGRTLKAAADEMGIDASAVSTDPVIHTTLAMVNTLPGGDREFSFYRNPGADMMLSPADLPEGMIGDTRIFHFGSVSLTDEPMRSATEKAVALAEAGGAMITYDPNLRENLWKSLDEAKEEILWGMGHCSVLKISDNEITWLTGEDDYTEGVKWIRARFDIPLILVSMGPEGSRAYYGDGYVEVKPFLQKDTIETTGAGDTFCACVINYVLENGLENLSEDMLREMLTFANAAASIITTRRGALRVMPEKQEVEAFLKERGF